MDPALVIFLVIVWLLFAGLGSYIATQKNREPVEGFFLGLLFGPLGAIIEGLLPTLQEQGPQSRKTNSAVGLPELENVACRRCSTPFHPSKLIEGRCPSCRAKYWLEREEKMHCVSMIQYKCAWLRFLLRVRMVLLADWIGVIGSLAVLPIILGGITVIVASVSGLGTATSLLRGAIALGSTMLLLGAFLLKTKGATASLRKTRLELGKAEVELESVRSSWKL